MSNCNINVLLNLFKKTNGKNEHEQHKMSLSSLFIECSFAFFLPTTQRTRGPQKTVWRVTCGLRVIGLHTPGINKLVRQNIILKKRTETSAKHEFSDIVLNLKIDSSFATSGLLPIDSE